jgi:hypothetical protein
VNNGTGTTPVNNGTGTTPVNNGTGTTPVNNGTGTTPVNNGTGNQSADFVNSILAVHNRERNAVGVPALVWSNELASDAKAWVEHIAATGEFAHDPNRQGEGENMWKGGTCEGRCPDYFSTADKVQSWVDEKKDYHGGVLTPENWYPTGHYTQMVWRDTTHVGCAAANGKDGNWDYLVCRYSPPGNYMGQKPY